MGSHAHNLQAKALAAANQAMPSPSTNPHQLPEKVRARLPMRAPQPLLACCWRGGRTPRQQPTQGDGVRPLCWLASSCWPCLMAPPQLPRALPRAQSKAGDPMIANNEEYCRVITPVGAPRVRSMRATEACAAAQHASQRGPALSPKAA